MAETNQNPGGGGTASTVPNIRRYLVLLHDCICIKFITVQQAQQRRLEKSFPYNNFPQQCCHYSCSEELSFGSGSCQTTLSPVAGGKCDWKSNNSEDPSQSDKGDHQECQFYRNHMGYHHSPGDQSTVKGSCFGWMNDNAAGGDQVNHRNTLNINDKRNKSTASVSSNNKGGDYDVISNHRHVHCPKCSNSSTAEWDRKNKNEHLIDAKGNVRSEDDGNSLHHQHHHSGNNFYRSAIMSKVDHSMQALFLYKEFRDINMNCFWNSAVYEAFKNLEYKGSIVPSTIIVGSPIRKHLNVLKTAWMRKMLRPPSGGYLIEFLGEIEELIADPIEKTHFVPLSDSLCWAIHELTSSGKEAFVENIFINLASAFPGIGLPTKELVYETLEKLTRERKVYQTPQGYFVITPDTRRYIMSTEPSGMIQTTREDTEAFFRNAMLHRQVTDMRLTPPTPLTNADEQKENEALRSSAANSPDPDTYSLPYGTFRRYNSLRIRKSVTGATGCLPRRTLSMRLPKTKKSGSKSSRQDVTGSFQNLDSADVPSSPGPKFKQLLSRRRKRGPCTYCTGQDKSFLSRLLSFRGVRRSSSRKEKGGKASPQIKNKPSSIPPSDKNSSASSIKNCSSNKNAITEAENDESQSVKTCANPSSGANSTNLATISTQTSFSLENLNRDLHLLSLGQIPKSKSSTLEREDSDSGRCTDSHSDADAEITAALNRGLTPLHDHFHLNHRRSGSCNIYEKIENDLSLKVEVDDRLEDGRSPSSQMSISSSPYSLGFCGRGGKQSLYSRSMSPASSSGNSYRDFYNLYRRRYPSYQQATPTPTSLETQSSDNNFTEQHKFRPSHPIRYPPRSFEKKQIFEEIGKEKKERSLAGSSGSKTIPISVTNNITQPKITGTTLPPAPVTVSTTPTVIHSHSSTNTTTTTTQSKSPSSNTTTTVLTQTLKNTTNLELEFRVPLGNLLKAAMSNEKPLLRQVSTPSSPSKESSEKKTWASEKRSSSAEGNDTSGEVYTVNDLFTIRSFVKANPFNDELSSTIEFKTNSSNNNSKLGSGGVTETVSSKPPFNDFRTKFNRESEII